MQPRCNSHLRPLLIEASWAAIRKSRTLFAYYSKHAGKSGKKAIVKVARKLALIAKGVATTGQPYQEDYLKKKQQEQQIKKDLKAGRFFSGITVYISEKMKILYVRISSLDCIFRRN
jgi:hypothetical protein